MDAYGQTLSDEAIWGLVVHIRELQARALRSTPDVPRPVNGVYETQHHKYRIVDVVTQGLKTPWAIDWLPDGKMLITNRPGPVHVWDGTRLILIEGTPESMELGQGGMMEVAVHPNYAQNGWIYLGYAEPAKSGQRAAMTKIVRGKIRFEHDSAMWTDQETIFEADQRHYTSAGVHFGVRIVFDGKGHVYFAIGERAGMDKARQLDSPVGKIFRVKDDGSIPSDNPFASADHRAKGHLGAIWSIGHRNPQGLVFDLDGNLWDTEHAPRGGDELNRIQKGADYGWPTVSFGINYNDSPFRLPWPEKSENITMPVDRWLPSTGVCGLDMARGPAFAKWRGDLLAGGLSGANVDRVRVKNDKVLEREEIFYGHGRVREVTTAKDGTIYIALNQPDKIVKLVPAD